MMLCGEQKEIDDIHIGIRSMNSKNFQHKIVEAKKLKKKKNKELKKWGKALNYTHIEGEDR